MGWTKKKSRADRFAEHASEVADRLIEQIRLGTAPFQKNYRAGERAVPHNLKTGSDYHGMNLLWLEAAREVGGFGDTRWGTYRQIQAIGGQVRHGVKGFRVVGGFDARTKEEKERDRDAGLDATHPRRRFLVYTVFNAEQCDGIAQRETEVPSWDPCQIADRILEKSDVAIVHGPVAKAYYDS